MIKEIAENILTGKAAFFCGAGISLNSGVPMVKVLLSSVLNKLGLEKEKSDLLINSNLPFEAYMESIIDNMDTHEFYKIFKNKKPSSTHYFLAQCLLRFHNKNIVTTNFDTLIEDACEIIRQDQINKDDSYNFNIIKDLTWSDKFENKRIIKIHGCISNEDKLDITLSKVASEEYLEKKEKLLRQIFVEGEHNIVIVMGYSCSDIFDISPILEKYINTNKFIYFIQHTNSSDLTFEDISIANYKNPFKNYNGVRVYIDTDVLISNLVELCKISIPFFSEPTFDWRIHISKWVKQWDGNIGTGHKKSLCSNLFMKISEYRIAESLLIEALETYRFENEFDKFYQKLQDLGLIYVHLNEINKSASCLIESIKYYEENRLIESLCVAYNNLGGTYLSANKIDEAISLFEQSLQIALNFQNFGYSKYIGNRVGNLANAYYQKRDFIKSEEYIELAIVFAKREGNKKLEGNMLYLKNLIQAYKNEFWLENNTVSNAENIFNAIGLYDNEKTAFFSKVENAQRKREFRYVNELLIGAENNYKFTLSEHILFYSKFALNFLDLNDIDKSRKIIYELNKLINHPETTKHDLSYIYDVNGHLLWKQKDFQSAEQYFLKAIELCVENDNSEWKVLLHLRLVEMLFEKNEIEKMYFHIKEALPIAEKIKDNYSLISLLSRLGDYHNIRLNDTYAMIYFKKAVAICQESGDQNKEAHLLNSIAKTHYNMFEYKYAIKTWLEAYELSGKTNNIELKKEIANCLIQLGLKIE